MRLLQKHVSVLGNFVPAARVASDRTITLAYLPSRPSLHFMRFRRVTYGVRDPYHTYRSRTWEFVLSPAEMQYWQDRLGDIYEERRHLDGGWVRVYERRRPDRRPIPHCKICGGPIVAVGPDYRELMYVTSRFIELSPYMLGGENLPAAIRCSMCGAVSKKTGWKLVPGSMGLWYEVEEVDEVV